MHYWHMMKSSSKWQDDGVWKSWTEMLGEKVDERLLAMKFDDFRLE